MKIITGSTGTTHITSDDDRQFNMAIFGNEDYVLPNGNKLAATLVNNNLITLADGDICMQGCHARIKANTSENCAIATGAVGKKRIDLICARYTLDTETGFENVELVVVKGAETTGAPVVPAINDTTELRNGATIHDMALYKVTLNGVNIESVDLVAKQSAYVWNTISNLSKATLSAGQTSVTITDSRIKEDSIIDPYFFATGASEPISYETIAVSNGSCTMTFEARDTNLLVGIRII